MSKASSSATSGYILRTQSAAPLLGPQLACRESILWLDDRLALYGVEAAERLRLLHAMNNRGQLLNKLAVKPPRENLLLEQDRKVYEVKLHHLQPYLLVKHEGRLCC
jgi:hypothetical protein